MNGASARSNRPIAGAYAAQLWLCGSIAALLIVFGGVAAVSNDGARSSAATGLNGVALAQSDAGAASTDRTVGDSSVSIQQRIAKKSAKGAKPYDQPGEAMKFFLQQRLGPNDSDYPVERLREGMQAIRAAEAVRGARGALPGGLQGWQELGPGNVGGRTRAILIDPNSPQIMYAAGVAGGVWKSTNGGGSWTATGDTMLNMAVSSMAMDPFDSQTIYAGTGEGFLNGDGVRGLGIFKTTDGGATWNQLDGTVTGVPTGAFHYVNDIVISPGDARRIYAATRFGVWRSVDSGASWQIVLSNPLNDSTNPTNSPTIVGCTDLAIRSDRPTSEVLLAAFGSFSPDGLYLTANGGDSWSRIGTPNDLQVINQGRMSLAIAPSDNDIMYVGMADNGLGAPAGTLVDVFLSTDGGISWEGRVNFSSTGINPWLYSNLGILWCGGGSLFSQGWYDNVIAVDPLNPAMVWVGGVDLFRSDDGGQNFRIASYWFLDPTSARHVHADHHALVFHPDYDGAANQTLYSGSDGGIARTDNARGTTSLDQCFTSPQGINAVRWMSLDNGYGTHQFYHGDSAKGQITFIGGAQDNGTNRVDSVNMPNSWREILGGDGGYVAISPTNPGIVYAETQNFPTIHLQVNGGTFQLSVIGITDSDGLFITPFAMDQVDPDTLYTGGRRPWRTTNGASSWSRIGGFLADSGRISAIGISTARRNTVYLGYSNGRVFRTYNATGTSPAWTEVSGGLPDGFISSLTVSPANDSKVYCTFSTFGVDHVFKSTDAGITWTSIDGVSQAQVPDIPAHWIEARPCDPDTLFLGTELGVFVSEDDGGTWQPANDNFPHTVVETLDFQSDDALVAFTHGRGAFRSLLDTCDCNNNGTDDGMDISTGASDDCNANGIPDDCEDDCNGNGVADICDIGPTGSLDQNGNRVPDECEPDCDGNGRVDELDVRNGAADCNANFVPDLCEVATSDCNNNGVPDECDTDCNVNGVADECDISAGTSPDCNNNGAPDECEGDCNNNGFPDECEVVAGTSDDCNGNLLPDECDVETPNGRKDVSDTNCCVNRTAPDCVDSEVADCVCSIDSICCDQIWDDICVQLVEALGCGSCTAAFSDDCNENDAPDECETLADCDSNGEADVCEIADGAAGDCNNNGTPDTCETDTDNDLVIDACDGCPDDRFKTQPGGCGCGTPDFDSDRDGAFDCPSGNGGTGPFDSCPQDASKTSPGDCGCGVAETGDSDDDGIPDCNDVCDDEDDGPDRDDDGSPDCVDECPDNPDKTIEGDCGCDAPETGDRDEDGVADCSDTCPNNGNIIQDDTDGDGLGDGCDGCPGDFNKTAVGLCGCGTADTDSDDDGVVDCLDNCVAADNPNQNDTDNDGAGDACDECPENPSKIAEGVCGCDRGDVDRDFDGILDCNDLCPNTAPGLAIDADGCAVDGGDGTSEPNPGDGAGQEIPGDDNADDGSSGDDDASGDGADTDMCGAMGMASLTLLFSGLVQLRRRNRRSPAR